MFTIFEIKNIAEGIRFCKYTDKRFKMNEISVVFFTEFDSVYSRSDFAVVPYILVDSNRKYPDYAKLSVRVSELYGASLTDNTGCTGDVRSSLLGVKFIDNRFALEGENIEREAAQLLLDCILDPLAENGAFDAETTRLMQGELTDAIRSVINDKRHFAAQRGAELAFKGEPMGLSVQGTVDEAERITPQSAYGAYSEMLSHGFIDIIAVGYSDFTESELLLTETFSKLKRENICVPRATPSRLKEAVCVHSERTAVKQAILRMYFKSPENNDRYASALLSMMLGGMATSRFFTKIREQQSLCYYCSSATNRFAKSLTVYAGVDAANVERTQAAVLDEFRDICENGVSEDELSRAKLEIINDMRGIGDSIGSIAGWYSLQLVDGETVTPEEYIERINAVTAERVQNICRSYSLDTVYALMPKGGRGNA